MSYQVTTTFDVREVIPAIRHQQIFRLFDGMAAGEAFIMVNDHEPKPLRYQFMHERPDQFSWDYLEEGPEVWRVQIGKRQAGSA